MVSLNFPPMPPFDIAQVGVAIIIIFNIITSSLKINTNLIIHRFTLDNIIIMLECWCGGNTIIV